ncbi:hypothetical protein AOLI_G00182930 [Acnodon oligacanthus]
MCLKGWRPVPAVTVGLGIGRGLSRVARIRLEGPIGAGAPLSHSTTTVCRGPFQGHGLAGGSWWSSGAKSSPSWQVGHLSVEIENRAGHLVRAEREGAKEDQISPHSVNRAGGGKRNRRVLCAQLTLRTLGAFRKKRPSEFKRRDKRERPGNPHEPCMRLFKCLAVPSPMGPTVEMDSAGEERGWCQTDLWQASPASLGWVATRAITANKTVKKATTWKCGQKKLSACRNNFYLPSSWKTFE